MGFMRGLVGAAPVLVFMAAQQFLSQTPAKAPSAPAQKAASAETPVERGKYLVTLGGCNDCHTPKTPTAELDTKRLLSGHPANEKLLPVPAGLIAPGKWGAITNNHLTAWVGGWGASFAPNLTPDKATGLGSWTPEMFVAALRTGKHRGDGRPILPPMPWQMYQGMKEDDLRAMFAYLQSLPPVNNMAPTPVAPDKLPK
jgi:cytochrome c553